MTQYDNEFFRGPPEGSPTLATDQRPTGVEVFQAKPEATTVVADIPVTREEAPKDPPKKKSNARRITKAIKLLASCMAAVVITEAATNIAATIEPPAEVPTGLYYDGQWPGVSASHNGVYVREMDSDMGYSIQMPLGENIWRFTADTDWRMSWYEGNVDYAFFGLYNLENGVSIMADLTQEPFRTDYEEDCYTTMTTSTGETLYIRAFFNSLGQYGEENGLDETMLAESAELRQALVEDAFAGIRVTPGTVDGWQGFQIGNKLYSQQSENWYGVGGFGDLEIHIPWVNYAEDYNLQNMTPYARENVNGITWSIYFAENDTYLWAVPNIDPEICLGGLTARFMCADAARRGEYISDEEWLEMGGFTSTSQRQTAVDILIECLQHHYALRDRWYPRDWPWKGATENASYWVWAESLKGTWTQFSFGDEAYRVNSTDPELRFYWEETKPLRGDVIADLEISRMVNNEEEYAIGLTVCRIPFNYVGEHCAYRTVQTTGGETLYLEFRSQYHANGADFTSAEMEPIADQILRSITFQSDPDDSGWCPLLLCDTMHSPANMEWSGCGIVGSNVKIHYIHTVENEGLNYETPIGTRIHNGITWTLYYDPGDEEWDSCIWAVPDIEPDVCIGFDAIVAMEYYRQQYMEHPDYEWYEGYELTAEDKNHAAETVSEALAYIYPLGVEPEKDEGWYIPDWPTIHQITTDHQYGLMDHSVKGTFAQFSLGDASYRLNSDNSDLRFFWNETVEVDGVMRADIHIGHMASNRVDWKVELFVQNEPFAESRGEETEIDATVLVSDGSPLYLRFRFTWYDGNGESPYEAFSGWVQMVMDAIIASPADPNGWGQVWICDLMTTPLGPNWDGNAMVTEDYEIPYFNRAEEQGLADLKPYAMLELNGIVWTFIYEEADDIIWGLPDFGLRPGSQWCIGAPAKDMAAWFLGGLPEGDYLDAAVEGLAAGLSKYYPRRDFVMQPVEEPEEEAVWPGLLPVDFGANYGVSFWSNQNTEGLFSLDGTVFEIGSYREDLRFWWEIGGEDLAAVTVYSIPDQEPEQWSVMMWIQRMPFETYDGDPSCYRTVNLPGNESLYLRFDGDETLADEILRNTSFDYCGKEENWHTIYIGNTLQTQQSYDWTGMSMVYQDYAFEFLHNADSVDLYNQDYKGQRTINGILWTFHFHKDEDIFYAYPDSEPGMAIGARPDILWNWYEAQYGTQDDYFETLVESMCEGLRYITLREPQ